MNLSSYCINLPTLLVFWGDFSSSFSYSNVLIVLIPWESGIPSLWTHHHYIHKLGHSITYCQNCEAVNTIKQYFWIFGRGDHATEFIDSIWFWASYHSLVFFYYLFQLQCFSALHAKHFETDEKTSSRTDEFLVKL